MIDITQPLTVEKVHELQALGHSVIAVYARLDRTPLSTIEAIHQCGSKVFTIWEGGFPTNPGYFTEDQANYDLEMILKWIDVVGQPQFTSVAPAYDCDCSIDQVRAYATKMHNGLKESNRFQVAYGCGNLLIGLANEGLTPVDMNTGKNGWLAGSKGWTGYETAKHFCAVIQTNENAVVAGISCDEDVLIQRQIVTINATINLTW